MSNGTIASITPLIPPRVNVVRKPSANSIGVSRCSTPRQRVASQEKILMPVGTAMIAVVTAIGMRIQVAIAEANTLGADAVKTSPTGGHNANSIIRQAEVLATDMTTVVMVVMRKQGSIQG